MRPIRHIRPITWVSLGLLVVLLPIVLFTLYRPGVSQAEWFNDAWGYRQPWSFTHNAALSDRRVTFTIDTQPLTTDKLQADCDDIRFTDNSGKLLRFQLTSACDLASTTFDVVIPTVISGLNSGYIYYGNPGASTASEDISAFTSLSPSGGAPAFTAEEEGTSPVTYWALDEGTDNTCPNGTDDICDSGPSVSGGTRTGATWQTENMCIAGKCLLFDGTNDVVTVTNTVANIQAVSFWVKVMSTSTTQEILDLNATDYFSSVSGTLTVNGFGTDTIYIDAVSGATTLTANKWHHVTVTTTTAFSASSIRMGQIGANFGNVFLDEVKLYTYALTAAQVKANFASKGISDGVSARFGQQDNAFLNDGLVGYWTMDEASWTNNCSTDTVLDRSGNDNNGDSCPNATGPTGGAGGKFGNSGDFDGSNDQISIPESTSLDITSEITLATWINPDSNGQNNDGRIINKADSYRLRLNSSSQLEFSVGGTFEVSTGTVSFSTWQHVAVTYNDVANLISFYINGASAGTVTTTDSVTLANLGTFIGNCDVFTCTFDGRIDDARVYSRALSPAEVRNLYNWAPGPVGYWKMDEGSWTNNCSTDTVFDSSGNGNNGDACPNSTGPTGGATGKFGKAGQFDGSNDYVSVPDAANGVLDPAAITLTAWVYINGSVNFDGNIFEKDSNNGYRLQVGASGGTPYIIFYDRGATNQLEAVGSYPANTRLHIAAVGSSSGLRIYVNGVLDNSNATAYNPGNSVANLVIGADDNLGEYFNGYIDEAKVYNYARTPQQIIEDMNAGHPAGGSPIASQVAYWEFDEQQGQTINNSNSAVALTANRGTTSGSESADFTWRTKENCKVNGCGDYDGTDDITTVTNATAIDINDNLASGFTFSAWINPDTVGETAGQFFNKGASTYCQLSSSSPFTLTCNLDYVTTDANVAVTSAIPSGSFTHVALTFNSTANTISIWINGVLKGTSGAGTGGLAADTSNLLIGGGASNNFDGRIDEFQVYSSELTADQMKVIANQGAVNNFGTGYDEAAQISGGAGNPPVGYWKMDERVGTSTNDTSGNGYTGTLVGGPTWANGKFGPGVSFDGSNDIITTGLDIITTSAYTVSFWVYPRALNQFDSFFTAEYQDSDFGFYYDGPELIFCNVGDFNCGVSGFATSNNNVLTLNAWNHVAVVYNDGGTATIYVNGVNQTADSTLAEGTSGGDFAFGHWYDGQAGEGLNGIMDEVRVYNYARTQAQIAYDFNRGGPIGHWQFDECSGGTANNNGSATSIDGTWSGSGGTNTAIGTCTSGNSAHARYNGATGKFNASLDFDDGDDIVTVTDNASLDLTSGLSISAWVNTSANEADNVIVSKGTSYELGVDGSGNVYWDGVGAQVDDGAGRVATGSWQHIVITNDDTTVTYYVNGVSTGTDSAGVDVNNATNLIIGGDSTNFFDGQIDDVRIFNYTLSAAQIRKLYNENSNARFGPNQGTP